MTSKTNRSCYICQQCGYKAPQYLGKCPQCDSWNSFVEQIEELSAVSRQRSVRQSGKQVEIIDLSKIQKTDYKRVSTKLEEFDRCLGGGIVNGSLVLVSGDPGIGKSTLLTQLALNINQSSVVSRQSSDKDKKSLIADSEAILKADDSRVLYIAGEESAKQIKIRVDRIKSNASLAVLNEIDVDNIIEAISLARPSLVIVDSIQTLQTSDLESIAGSVGQVRECTHRLQRLAKDIHVPIFLVGHVTKEGNIAGPKTLEHVVDVVLSLEGDPASMFRILRATKNRFGPTDEVGVFEMVEGGMIEVTNPSKVFLNTKQNAPGSAVVAIQSGFRPLLLEIQALVTKSGLPIPRRVGNGIDNNRLQLLVAVLQKRLGLTLFDVDIYVNVVGGLKISEPAADLGVCTAIVSSFKDIPIREKTVLIGEVGLLGELRAVRQIDKRIKEAQKLGYSNVISSQNARNLSEAMKLALVDNL
ncbi:MAG: DNA repair protein RadA [Candidatus Daviesbacteria bacterium]|nr:DNA repair protein RadA [Candidatus Daviesbacteria bacterium]